MKKNLLFFLPKRMDGNFWNETTRRHGANQVSNKMDYGAIVTGSTRQTKISG